MNWQPVLVVSVRWLHIVAACLAVGGVFFIRFLLPAGLRKVEADQGKLVFLGARRAFKMVIHTCILVLLLTGTYNAVRNWHGYAAAGPGLGHGLFGLHLLLALVVFGISLWLLTGTEPPASHRKWAAINMVLLLLTVAAASTVKYVREAAVAPKTISSANPDQPEGRTP